MRCERIIRALFPGSWILGAVFSTYGRDFRDRRDFRDFGDRLF
jgi:hypothetical protein